MPMIMEQGKKHLILQIKAINKSYNKWQGG